MSLYTSFFSFCLYLKQQAVDVRVQQLAARAVDFLEVAVVEVVHHNLSQLQDAHADLDGSAELELGPVHQHPGEKVAAEDGVPVKQGARGELPHFFTHMGADSVHVYPVA